MPRIAAAIHRVILAVPRSLVPVDLALKHTYDFQPIEIPVALITSRLKTSAWRYDAGHGLARLRAASQLSGGWKALQRHPSRNLFGRFVARGDWDLRARPIRHRPVIEQLFVDGLSIEETDEYKRLRDYITTGQRGSARGMTSTDDLDRYFADLVATYEAIATTGYRTQVSLGEDGADEVRVCIDRHGHVAEFGGGSHRLAIASQLGIARIPVVVKRVHADWVAHWQERTGANVQDAVHAGLEELTGRREPET